jgi:molecular chaperone GrpE (heat shock protein)
MDDGDGAQEVVSEELQAGYRIGDDVIRHAMVKVTMQ